MKLLLYCTKKRWKKRTLKLMTSDGWVNMNGKIIAKCDCNFVEKINCCCVPYKRKDNLGYEHYVDNGVYKVEWKKKINLPNQYANPKIYKDDGVVFERNDSRIDSMLKNCDLKKISLSPQELLDYITLGNSGYLLHLAKLKFFATPRLLSYYGLKRAPQSMCYVYDKNGNRYVLLPIKGKYLELILKGEKTIEVRRKILKSLQELIK